LRTRHYHQYDTYYMFEDQAQGRIRYREDDFIADNGQITNVRSRLTLIGPARERHFPQRILLSRSRYLAPATQSLRFYKEYFKPARELEVEKDRLRFLIRYHGTEFFINIDHVTQPDLGHFLEVKSHTWSRQDAELKSQLVAELVALLGVSSLEPDTKDYFEFVEAKPID